MADFSVLLTDQVFPSVEIERELLSGIGATLEIADGTLDGITKLAPAADAVLTTYFPINAELMGSLRKCRIIARYGMGVDNIDLDAARGAGITVTNVPDYSMQEVAAHTLALALSLVRRIPQADRLVREGKWSVDNLRPIHRVSGLTFGLVGFGRIGRLYAQAVAALGARMLMHDPYVTAPEGAPPNVSLDELVAQSDVVSIHAPLTPETRGLFNARLLGKMRQGAFLVNTSRGPVVDLADLIEALRSGHLAGAALDVFDKEPLDPSRIAGVPNLLVSPHMGYYSEESLQESQRKATTQIIKVLTGQAPDYPVGRS